MASIYICELRSYLLGKLKKKKDNTKVEAFLECSTLKDLCFVASIQRGKYKNTQSLGRLKSKLNEKKYADLKKKITRGELSYTDIRCYGYFGLGEEDFIKNNIDLGTNASLKSFLSADIFSKKNELELYDYFISLKVGYNVAGDYNTREKGLLDNDQSLVEKAEKEEELTRKALTDKKVEEIKKILFDKAKLQRKEKVEEKVKEKVKEKVGSYEEEIKEIEEKQIKLRDKMFNILYIYGPLNPVIYRSYSGVCGTSSYHNFILSLLKKSSDNKSWARIIALIYDETRKMAENYNAKENSDQLYITSKEQYENPRGRKTITHNAWTEAIKMMTTKLPELLINFEVLEKRRKQLLCNTVTEIYKDTEEFPKLIDDFIADIKEIFLASKEERRKWPKLKQHIRNEAKKYKFQTITSAGKKKFIEGINKRLDSIETLEAEIIGALYSPGGPLNENTFIKEWYENFHEEYKKILRGESSKLKKLVTRKKTRFPKYFKKFTAEFEDAENKMLFISYIILRTNGNLLGKSKISGYITEYNKQIQNLKTYLLANPILTHSIVGKRRLLTFDKKTQTSYRVNDKMFNPTKLEMLNQAIEFEFDVFTFKKSFNKSVPVAKPEEILNNALDNSFIDGNDIDDELQNSLINMSIFNNNYIKSKRSNPIESKRSNSIESKRSNSIESKRSNSKILPLKNIGNTCYANSSFQLIHLISEGKDINRNLILANDHIDSLCANSSITDVEKQNFISILKNYLSLISRLTKSKKTFSATDLEKLLKAHLQTKIIHYENSDINSQQDCAEFLRSNLDILFPQIKKNIAITEKNTFYNITKETIDDLTKENNNTIITLNIPEALVDSYQNYISKIDDFSAMEFNSPESLDQVLSIGDLLSDYQKETKIEHSIAKAKKTNITKTSKYIFFYINRNIYIRSASNRQKIYNIIEAPDICLNGKNYECIAKIHHIGNGVGGHYVTQRSDIDGEDLIISDDYIYENRDEYIRTSEFNERYCPIIFLYKRVS